MRSRIFIALAALLAVSTAIRAEDGEDAGPDEFEFHHYGFSGNMAAVVPPSPTPIPALGARGSYADNDGSFIRRIHASGMVGGIKDSEKAVAAGSARLRAAAGVLEKNNLAYSAVAFGSLDAASHDGEGRAVGILIGGGELGRRWTWKDRNMVLVGAHSGVALAGGRQGTEINDRNVDMVPLEVPHDFGRVALAVGGSVLGKIGEDGHAGTVIFDGSGSVLVGQGAVVDAAVDVNLSEHIQLGVGINGSRLYENEEHGAVNAVQPYVRLTLSEQKAKKKPKDVY